MFYYPEKRDGLKISPITSEMSKPSELNEIRLRKYPVKMGVKSLKPREVLGFDTETNKKGYASLIAASNGFHKVPHDIGEVLRFLTQNIFMETTNFFFNLEFDTGALLKYLPFKNLEQISYYNQTIYGDYKIKIIPKKMLLIRKGRHQYAFYDIAQFYQMGSLVNTYNKTFKKEYTKRLDASKGFERKEINEEAILYCIEDSKAAQELAVNFVRLCRSIVPLNRFISPASLSKTVLKANLKEDYVFKKNKIQEIALRSYNGGRIEVMQKGYFDKAYVYDIVSAYPSIQWDLDNLGRINTINERYENEALHSFYKIKVQTPECIISPVRHTNDQGLLMYPYGKKELYVTQKEIETLMKYDIKHQIIKGYHNWGEPEKPFYYMKDMFYKRRKLKEAGNPLQLPMKLALNSSYGITIERTKKYTITDYNESYDKRYDVIPLTNEKELKFLVPHYQSGMFFNPVWAAEITSAIRCKLYEDSIKYEDNIIKYSTDSITLDKKIKLDFGRDLGQYEDSNKYEGLVIGNGVYHFFNDKEKINKFRSFGKENILEIAQENKNKTKVDIIKKAPKKMKETRKERFKDLNIFKDKKKSLSINFDHKRQWDRNAKDFKDLLNNRIRSKALKVCDY